MGYNKEKCGSAEVYMASENLRWKRVLLKLSGEAIGDKENGSIFDAAKVAEIADIIARMTKEGCEVGVVIGAGNIWRGAYGKDVRRARADQMGMLATMINCLRLEDAVEKTGTPVTVMSPVIMNSFAEKYDFRAACDHLKNGMVVIFGAGLGIPYITTDTACVVRAAEIEADILLMAKNVDGVYTADPNKDPSARKYRVITSRQCVDDGLKAIDESGALIAAEQDIDAYVFSLNDPENILRVIRGEEIGTLLSSDESVKAELY